MNWMTELKTDRDAAAIDNPQQGCPSTVTAAELREAAKVFAARTDSFAAGKADICADMAAKLERFGTFVSQKQADFAAKLVLWSKPREQQAPRAPLGVSVQRLFAVMQKFAKVRVGRTEISRRNQDSLCWVLYNGACVGKIENGSASLFAGKAAAAGTSVEALTEMLVSIDTDPVKVLAEHGKLSGRCSCCGRDLTDPESIAFGIGPVCRGKLMGGF